MALAVMSELLAKHADRIKFRLILQHKSGLYVSHEGMSISQRHALEFECGTEGATTKEVVDWFITEFQQIWLKNFIVDEFEIISDLL